MSKIELPPCPSCHVARPEWTFSVLSSDSRLYRMGGRGGIRAVGSNRGGESDDLEDIRAICSSCGHQFYWHEDSSVDALIEAFQRTHHFYG